MSKNKHIPWAIVNSTGRYLHFRKGQVLGIATNIKEEELKPNVSSVEKAENEETEEKPSDKLAAFSLDHIPEDQKQKLSECLMTNMDVFVQKDAELTTINVTEMTINTQDHPPTYQHPRRLPLAYRETLRVISPGYVSCKCDPMELFSLDVTCSSRT